MSISAKFLAHSKNRVGKADLLRDHLTLVSERASRYASAFGAEDEGRLAGLLHDIGKYGELFQRRLQGKESGIDHWSAGTLLAYNNYGEKGLVAAIAMQGHHIGIQPLNEFEGNIQKAHPSSLRLSTTDHDLLLQRILADGIKLPLPNDITAVVVDSLDGKCASMMLDVRMLFSTLVDADFIETEAFFTPDAGGHPVYRESGLPLEPGKALNNLLSYIDKLASTSEAARVVNKIRENLLESCLDAAVSPQGLFTLTAPTGTGKTLSMLAFALKHAEQHHLKRIILVLPYLNIIDQTVREYHRVFSSYLSPEEISRYIFEHHSLAGTRERREGASGQDNVDTEDEAQSRKQALTENWDAPIIITTSVQFLESLFGNRPGSSRKLHNLAGSVILFDEVQTLPNNLVIPTLATLSRLAERYRGTIVFATATQPAFRNLHQSVKEYCMAGWQPSEIVPESLKLFERAKRVKLEWNTDKPIGWVSLAENLKNEKQALCIVNLKRHAAILFDELNKLKAGSVFHLSTSMCPAHRRNILDGIRRRLKENKPCRLISTQCIEAGVDVDFPAVYRAFGPLDAIAQAAGRCNRNGRNPTGTVHVFKPEIEENGRLYPDKSYEQAAGVTAALLKRFGKDGMDINNPALFTEYYRLLYQIIGIQDNKTDLTKVMMTQNFKQVAELYRLIDQDTVNVLVPYENEMDAYENLKKDMHDTGLTRDWIRKGRPLTINLFRPRPDDPVVSYLEPVMVYRRKQSGATESGDWFIYLEKSHYHTDKGLVLPEKSRILMF